MEAIINKKVVHSYFSGTATPVQKKLIETWLIETENRAQYYQWLHEWELAHLQTAPDWHPAFSRTVDRLQTPARAVEPGEEPTYTNWFWRRGNAWMVAATLSLILGGWLFADALRYQTIQTGFGEIRSLTLPDGSTVMLKANSVLQTPRWGFGRKTREVVLKGEASFSVRHLPDAQKFVVKTYRQVDVVVLGTEFTVIARKRMASVLLNKGKVQLHYREGKDARQIIMKPGDLATLDAQNHIALRTNQPRQLPVDSQGNQFVFDETTLQEVAYLLEEGYGLEVKISSPMLAKRVLMGSFQADNVDQLLQSISELLNVSVVREGNHVQISAH